MSSSFRTSGPPCCRTRIARIISRLWSASRRIHACGPPKGGLYRTASRPHPLVESGFSRTRPVPASAAGARVRERGLPDATMSYSMSLVKLHRTVGVRVGDVQVGGGAPIVVQSMTLTDTADARATADQCIDLAAAGSEMVRVTVNLPEAAAAVPEIKQRML